MGLAASQARLLTITSRKSRAQFENMRLSHQKLALSRNLTDISNEYQNSLNQTKLYYDFYGVNSTDTPLTYDLLMSPSSINDYTPTLITNNQNQVILSTPYAEAAKASGIPMEGLGCQPSSILRDTFMQNLAAQGIITQNTADLICNIDYNQGAGLGNSNLVNTVTTTGDYDALMEVLDDPTKYGMNTCSISENVAILKCDKGEFSVYTDSELDTNFDSVKEETTGYNDITFADLLNGESSIYLAQESETTNLVAAANNVINGLASTMLGTVAGANDAVAYANMKMNEECWGDFSQYLVADETAAKNGTKDIEAQKNLTLSYHRGEAGDIYGSLWNEITGGAAIVAGVGLGLIMSNPVGWVVGAGAALVGSIVGTWDTLFGDVSDSEVARSALSYAGVNLGMGDYYGESGWFKDDPHDQAALDLSAYAKAWFTYFMQYMLGLGSAKSNELSVKWNYAKMASNFATKDNIGDYKFTFTTEYVSDNEALIANFYDTLFNQICMNGWAKNSQIDKDSNYLKEMLQSGMMYVTSMSDDYYFYQNNYSTNSFIKEVSDDAAIAEAESKYTTEKARINAKEQELDLKMKNLDTEISSLETEYEAVKKVIENNASKSFTRYDG